nr:SulP family inorganic anion transporter [Pseudomonas sp. BIGb0427]
MPGALLGVAVMTAISIWLALPVNRVEVPANLSEAIDWLSPADLLHLADPNLLVAAFALAFIASAETLLSAAAVDRMHNGQRSDFDRELSAQGLGNMLCGVLGALPMTGVIVRSSANVQAGRKRACRRSCMGSGYWLSWWCSAACCSRFRWRAWRVCWSTPGSSWSTSRPFAGWGGMAGCRCSPMRRQRWRSSSPTC